MAEVAVRSGVSTATVSRVLNNVGSTSDTTRQRVLQAAQDLNYTPDPRFRMLARQRGSGALATNNIAFLLKASPTAEHFTSDPYYGRLFWGLERTAQELNYHLVVSILGDRDANALPPIIVDRMVDGIVAHAGLDLDLIARIKTQVPMILVNDMVEGLGVSSLMPDEHSGIRQALAYLKALGHHRIVFFYIDDAPQRIIHHVVRRDSFKRLALEGPDRIEGARLEAIPRRTKSLDDTAMEQLVSWRNAGRMPTALVCATDVHAVAFLHAAMNLGLSVPGDLSIVGNDDMVVCGQVRPRLTSIRQPLEAMGRIALQTLVNGLRHPEEEQVAVTQLFDVKLIERDSCGPCPSTTVAR